MKKVWEVIKKVFCWLGAVGTAIFAVLFIRERDCRVEPDNDTRYKLDNDTTTEEINEKSAKKREEAIERISNADARSVCESYGSVCDAINDGKERFRRRCERTDN